MFASAACGKKQHVSHLDDGFERWRDSNIGYLCQNVSGHRVLAFSQFYRSVEVVNCRYEHAANFHIVSRMCPGISFGGSSLGISYLII